MILSRQSILGRVARGDLVITPFAPEKTIHRGKTYGLGGAGYDIRIKLSQPEVKIWCGGFMLATAVEFMAIPNDLVAEVKDKSSWARLGLAVQNTTIEPGWRGFLTLELSYHGHADCLVIRDEDPIAQIVFKQLDRPTDRPYEGRYQDQPQRPVPAIEARDPEKDYA
jgi:dCTP deaminase